MEDWLRVHFPRVAAVILDFWHAAQYLSAWAKALHPTDAAEAARVAGVWCHKLKHESGAAVLAELRALDVGRRPAAREAHRQLLVYVENSTVSAPSQLQRLLQSSLASPVADREMPRTLASKPACKSCSTPPSVRPTSRPRFSTNSTRSLVRTPDLSPNAHDAPAPTSTSGDSSPRPTPRPVKASPTSTPTAVGGSKSSPAKSRGNTRPRPPPLAPHVGRGSANPMPSSSSTRPPSPRRGLSPSAWRGSGAGGWARPTTAGWASSPAACRVDHALVDFRLDLPEEWTGDRKRCREAGVPKATTFRTRHELALEMPAAHGAELPHQRIGGGDEMGRPAAFRRELRSRSERHLLAVPSDTPIRDPEGDPPAYAGRGRPPGRPFVRVSRWCAALPATAWTRIDVRDGTRGPVGDRGGAGVG